MITINAKFSQEMQSLGLIGRVGENASRQIVFDCSEVLTEFSGASILCVLRRSKDEMPYTADVTMSGTNATLTLADTDLAVAGYLNIELRAIKNGVVYKSSVFTGTVALSLYGDADKPGEVVRDVLDRVDATLTAAEATRSQLATALEGVDGAVSSANTAANNAQTVADTVQTKLDNGDFVGATGPAGSTGADGVSPTVAVSKTGKVATVTITDKDGEHTFTVNDGADGSGAGDMLKATYDKDGNGIVDDAEKLGGKSPDAFADAAATNMFMSVAQSEIRDHDRRISELQTELNAKTDTTYTLGIRGNTIVLTPSIGSAQQIIIPLATGSALGLVKIGTGLTISEDGTVSSAYSFNYADGVLTIEGPSETSAVQTIENDEGSDE